MKGGNKYGKPVPGQPQPQSINRPREHGEIKDCDINPLRNKRDGWKINTVPFKGGHYAAYPPKLVETLSLIHIWQELLRLWAISASSPTRWKAKTAQAFGLPAGSVKADRKSTRLNSSHSDRSRMPSSA